MPGVKPAKVTRGIVDQLDAPAAIAVQEIEKRGPAQGHRHGRHRYAANQGRSTDYVAVIRPGDDSRGIEPGFLLDTSRVEFGNVRQLGERVVSDGRCEGGSFGGEGLALTRKHRLLVASETEPSIGRFGDRMRLAAQHGIAALREQQLDFRVMR